MLNIDDSLARQHLEAIRDDGLDTVYFAWMGPTTPGSGIYYRIHGPSILIEFTHARNQGSGEPDPNHVHTVVTRSWQRLWSGLVAHSLRDQP